MQVDIEDIIRRHSKSEIVDESLRIYDEFDSLTILDICLDIEGLTQGRVPIDALIQCQTLGEIMNELNKRLS